MSRAARGHVRGGLVHPKREVRIGAIQQRILNHLDRHLNKHSNNIEPSLLQSLLMLNPRNGAAFTINLNAI